VGKRSTRQRVISAFAGAVIVVIAVVVAAFWRGGNKESVHYTAVNRHLSLVARDVLRAVAQWQEATGAAEQGGAEEGADGGAAAPAANPASAGPPVELTVFLREQGVAELPDDLEIVVCDQLRPWCDVNDATGFKPVVAARSPSTLGGDVVLYDGQGITVVAASTGPAWLATGVVWTKADIAGGEQDVTFKR